MLKTDVDPISRLPEQNSAHPTLTRAELAERWKISEMTLKRREKEGLLQPIRFGGRSIRYSLKTVEKIEQEGVR